MRATILSLVALASALPAQYQLAVRDAEPVFGIDPAAIATGGLSAGDLDGDGDLDLVAPGGLLLRNAGGFFDAADAVVPVASGETALIDVDGDGDLDVFQAGWDPARTRPAWILINDGGGRLRDASAARIVGMPVRADDVEVVDVDGDGDPDVVLAGAQGLGLLENRAGVLHDVTAGRFPPQLAVRTAVAATDADGDGDPDLVAWSGELLANDGQGTFSLVPGSGLTSPSYVGLPTDDVLAGDLDGDGDEDVVVGDLVHLNAGGRYTPSAPLPAVALAGRAVAMIDVDADADLDLVVGGFIPLVGRSDSAAVLRNDGLGGFTSAPPIFVPTDGMSSTAALPVDVDGDRDIDLVLFPNERSRARLLRNDGSGRFTLAARARVAARGILTGGVIADLDGDGAVDAARQGNVIHWNDGSGTFDAVVPLTGPTSWDLVQAGGDVDGDGDIDLVGWSLLSQSARLFRNVGNRTFVDDTAGRLSDSAGLRVAEVLVDLDGDGDLDLLIGDSERGSGGAHTLDRLHRNDGTGTFVLDPNGVAGPASDTHGFLPVDVDGDGDLDVVRAGAASTLLQNDGAGRLTPVAGIPARDAYAISSGDIDSDGDVDLLLDAWVLVNDGTGRFTDETAQRLPGYPTLLQPVLADIDGDGAVDVVGPGQLWRNDGSGVFVDVSAARIEPPFSTDLGFGLSVADIDADGDVDVMTGPSIFGTQVFVNHHRQLTSPGEPVRGGRLTLVVHSEPGYGTSPALAIPLLGPRSARVLIAGIGVLGLDPGTMVALGARFVPAPAGELRITIAVPNTPTLRGPVFSQCLLSTTSGLALTRAVQDTIR